MTRLPPPALELNCPACDKRFVRHLRDGRFIFVATDDEPNLATNCTFGDDRSQVHAARSPLNPNRPVGTADGCLLDYIAKLAELDHHFRRTHDGIWQDSFSISDASKLAELPRNQTETLLPYHSSPKRQTAVTISARLAQFILGRPITDFTCPGCLNATRAAGSENCCLCPECSEHDEDF